MLKKEKNSRIEEVNYKLTLPFTNYRFISPIKKKRIVYYYDAEIKIGNLDDRFGEGLVSIILSPSKDSIPIYENFISEAATSIKNGLFAMLFTEDYIELLTEDDIRWFIFLPGNEKYSIGRYKEVKLKWNMEKRIYENAYFLDENSINFGNL